MENRERDRVSQRTSPTDAGKLNRRTEEEKGRETGSSVEFGKNIGHSEDLDANTKGGSMNRNKQQENMENESSRRSGGESGYGSSSGRSSGSSGSMGSSKSSGGSNISGDRSESVRDRSGSQGSSGNWGDSSDRES